VAWTGRLAGKPYGEKPVYNGPYVDPARAVDQQLRDDWATIDQPHQHAALGPDPIRTIGREELKIKLDRGDDFKLIMALNRWAFEAKHIPGSIHFDTSVELYAAVRPDDEVVVCCSWVDCEDAGLPLEGRFAAAR